MAINNSLFPLLFFLTLLNHIVISSSPPSSSDLSPSPLPPMLPPPPPRRAIKSRPRHSVHHSHPPSKSPPSPPPPTRTVTSPPLPLIPPPSPPPPSIPPPSPPPPPQQQLNNIIDALIGAGDFLNWANILSGANLTTLPLSATLFIPQDSSLSRLPMVDPFLFPYHIVPQRLSFSDLQLFKTDARLPTLLPGKSIIVTNSSRLNFTVDGSPITQPDLYLASTIAVHGVGAVLDYSAYGDGLNLLPRVSPGNQLLGPPQSPPRTEFLPSDAACLGFNFLLVFMVVIVVSALNIHIIPVDH